MQRSKPFIVLTVILITILLLATDRFHIPYDGIRSSDRQGTGVKVQMSATMSGVVGAPVCDDGNKNTGTNGCGGAIGGGIDAQTVNYTLTSGDGGKLVTMNGSNLTATLPASPPSSTWFAWIEDLHSTALTISRNGLTINGGSSNITLIQYQAVKIWTDGSNYFAGVPEVAGSNVTLTSASNGITVASTAGSGGGVNTNTVNYTLVSGDNAKLVTMNGSSLTATLPASPPSSTWFAWIQDLNSTALTISRNGLTINGGTSNLTLTQYQMVKVWSDGSNYFASPPLVAGSNITLTSASNGITIASTGGGGGSFTFVEGHTASASSTLDFTTCLSSTYDTYQFEFVNIIPSATANILMRVNVGSGFDSGANYNWAGFRASKAGSAAAGASTDTSFSLDASGTMISSTNTYSFGGSLQVFDPLNTANYKRVRGDFGIDDGTGNPEIVVMMTGSHKSTSAWTQVRFLPSTGNFTSGTIRCNGISH